MPTDPAEILFSTYRRRLLSFILLRPGESFHVRELERLTGVPAGSLHRELKLLAGAGLLTRQPVGNQVRYQANRANPIFEELASIFRKTSGLAGVLREALAPLGNRVKLAFVFGSMARGDAKPGSDVDILILGEATLKEVVGALAPLHDFLGREINPVVMTAAKFADNAKQRDRFVTRVLDGPKIFIQGDKNDLAELGDYRTA